MVGIHNNSTGLTPLLTKTEAIMKLDNPKTLKQLRSFLGSVHHLTKIHSEPRLSLQTTPTITQEKH